MGLQRLLICCVAALPSLVESFVPTGQRFGSVRRSMAAARTAAMMVSSSDVKRLILVRHGAVDLAMFGELRAPRRHRGI